jgi:hypothetical protein
MVPALQAAGDDGAVHSRNLDSRFADRPGAAVDEDMLAGCQPGLVDQPVPRRDAGGSKASRILEGDVAGLQRQGGFVRDHGFSQRAAFLEARKPEDRIARDEARDAGPDGGDRAGEVEPHGARKRLARDDLHLAVAQLPVDGVDGCELDLHGHLSLAGRRQLELVEPHQLRTTVHAVLNALHDRLLLANDSAKSRITARAISGAALLA